MTLVQLQPKTAGSVCLPVAIRSKICWLEAHTGWVLGAGGKGGTALHGVVFLGAAPAMGSHVCVCVCLSEFQGMDKGYWSLLDHETLLGQASHVLKS